MAAAKIRVSDIAKRMGKSEKDVIFQLQSLGAEITDASQALEPEVIQALITGKKLSTRTKSVIMREDKPQVSAKKETVVRPPRPIIKPPVRAKKETPVEEAPAAPPTPSVIIPEFVQAAEAEERAALEAPAPIAERPPRAPEPPAEQPMAAAPAEQPAAPPPAMQPPPSTHIRPTGGTGPRARAPQGPRPNYAGQQPIRSVGARAPMGGQRPPMSARPAGPGGAPRPMGPGGPRPVGPGGPRPMGPGGPRPVGAGMRGPGGGPGLRPQGPGRPAGPPPPAIPGMLPTRRKKPSEGEELTPKKKTTGNRGKSERPSDVDNELFTKGGFSGTQIIADDLGPDIPPETAEEEKARTPS